MQHGRIVGLGELEEYDKDATIRQINDMAMHTGLRDAEKIEKVCKTNLNSDPGDQEYIDLGKKLIEIELDISEAAKPVPR